MSTFKNYWMWWRQSLTNQSFQYGGWKKSTHCFKGRTQKEATSKMNKFLDMAGISGRFLCVEEGYDVTSTGEETKSPMEQILELAISN